MIFLKIQRMSNIKLVQISHLPLDLERQIFEAISKDLLSISCRGDSFIFSLGGEW